jgi:putative Mg2+ transporter-C (MgtC) family protein
MNAWIDNLLRFDELVQLFRIVLACLLGACIGFEREKYGRPAGLRTHMIVCVASSLAMLVSIYGFEGGDPARLAAQVISGIGFIGAGAIIVRGDKDIMGITTAATIWICAIIGLACGNGYYFGAIMSTAASLIILTCFVGVESTLSKKRTYKSSVVALIKYSPNVIDKVKEILDGSNITLSSLDYKNTTYEGEKIVRVTLNIEKHVKVHELNGLLMTFDKEFEMVQCKVSNDGIDVKKKQRNNREIQE